MNEQRSPASANPEPTKKPPRLHRRRFLETGAWAATGVVGLTLFGTGGRFIVGDALKEQEAQWVNLGAVADLPIGQMHRATFTLRRKDAWRTTEEQGLLYVFSEDGAAFTVLSAVCTHLGCNVHWEEETSEFRCPCHDAHFSQAGEVMSGPPQRALSGLESKIENGTLLVLV